MKLHAVDGQLLVLQAHDLALVIPGHGGDLQAVRESVALHQQGVITGGCEGLRQVFEDGLAAVLDDGGLAMHQAPGADDIAAEDMADALMAQADAEDRRALAKGLDDVATDACLLRRAGAGGHADVVRLHLGDLLQRDLVIAMDLHLGPHLAEVLDEVVGEGVVIVDDQQHAGIIR